jgi:hypothetical protein
MRTEKQHGGTNRNAIAFVAPLVLALGVAAQGAGTPKSFAIKQDDLSVGSNIRRGQVWGPLPYDKTYEELSEEERRLFKSRYVQMRDGDEPPFPVEGLGPLYTGISKVMRSADAGLGVLEMDVLVDAAGVPAKVEVLKSPDPKLAGLAARVAMLTRFKPALCNGEPCAMGFPVRINIVRR